MWGGVFAQRVRGGERADPWKSERWQRHIRADAPGRRDRVFVLADCGVHAEVRRARREFAEWPKGRSVFPLPLRVSLRDRETLRAMDDGFACGTFFEPVNFEGSAYVRVAVGDYADLAASIGQDSAPATLPCAVAHELAHDFQGRNGSALKGRGQWQAERCARDPLRACARTHASRNAPSVIPPPVPTPPAPCAGRRAFRLPVASAAGEVLPRSCPSWQAPPSPGWG